VTRTARIVLAAGGLAGAAGVALAAAAAHRGGPNLAVAAQMLLVHAAALPALAAAAATVAGSPRITLVGAGLAGLGTALFAGTLALGDLAGIRPIPMAAPTGGTLMILGWLVATAGAFGTRRGDSGSGLR
jgi:uncharacterized membrane protein YgdD (TMEM256/DUF423 family)